MLHERLRDRAFCRADFEQIIARRVLRHVKFDGVLASRAIEFLVDDQLARFVVDLENERFALFQAKFDKYIIKSRDWEQLRHLDAEVVADARRRRFDGPSVGLSAADAVGQRKDERRLSVASRDRRVFLP